jgi:hypothetical protein
MKRQLCLASVVIALLMSSCSPQAASQTATPDILITELPAHTETPRVTNTDKPILTSTVTLNLITETPTPDFYATDFWVTTTAIVEAGAATTQPKIHASYLSPDKKWRVDVIIYDCTQIIGIDFLNSYEQLKLIEVETGIEKVIDARLLNCGGLGAAGLDGLFWSANSQYFYYTDARFGVPDGLCGYWERPVHQLDVLTQKVEFSGGGPLSPDKTKIAVRQENDLVIWGLNEGELARAPLVEGTVNGSISWSPDNQSLVYIQTTSYCFPFGKSYVIYFDISKLEQKLLLESDTPSFVYAEWDAPNRIKLSDEQGNQWRYNLVTGELQPAP